MRGQELILWCLPPQLIEMKTLLVQTHAAASGMIAARRIADLPSDRATPTMVVEEIIRQIVAYSDLHYEVLDEQQIQQRGLGVLHAVGKGAKTHHGYWYCDTRAATVAHIVPMSVKA